MFCAPNRLNELPEIRFEFPFMLIGKLTIETFRFSDENDYEYEIWFKVFSRIVK